MKLHAVVGISKSSLLIQVISCYCEDCLNENYFTSWVKTTFEARSKDNVSISMEVEAIVHAYKEDENHLYRERETKSSTQKQKLEKQIQINSLPLLKKPIVPLLGLANLWLAFITKNGILARS